MHMPHMGMMPQHMMTPQQMHMGAMHHPQMMSQMMMQTHLAGHGNNPIMVNHLGMGMGMQFPQSVGAPAPGLMPHMLPPGYAPPQPLAASHGPPAATAAPRVPTEDDGDFGLPCVLSRMCDDLGLPCSHV